MIRLEGTRIYPGWQPPIDRTPAISIFQSTGNPPRFWKGIVTDSMDIGEVQLLLCWEQGEDYKEVRVLGFLLEFRRDGVKDVLNQLESKRSFEKYLAQMIAGLDDVETKNCTLAQGRRLLLDALAINKQYGTTPHRDYRLNLSLINQLILEVPDLEDDDEPLFDEDDDYRHAEIFLKKAERLDPEADFVQLLRPILELKKSEPGIATNPPRKFLQKKKER